MEMKRKLIWNWTGSEPENIRELIGNHSNSDFWYRSFKRLVVYWKCQRGTVHIRVSNSTRNKLFGPLGSFFLKFLYERWAGISVGVDLGQDVIIDAVSKGFDGREVSKVFVITKDILYHGMT